MPRRRLTVNKSVVTTPYEEFYKMMKSNFGLSFNKENKESIDRKIKDVCDELGFDNITDGVSTLISSYLSEDVIDILARHFLIKESYFFRDPRCFETLEKEILPKFISKRLKEGKRYLRIWSAGCAEGEEPYSIAILLHKLIPDIDDWDITLLATDINTDSLKKASTGIYKEWSLRDTPSWVKKEYFIKKGSSYEIIPEIKKLILFNKHNLVKSNYPNIMNHTVSMDVILCRNVLIYFDKSISDSVIGKFYNSLSDDGLLILSPAETTFKQMSEYKIKDFEKMICFQKNKLNLKSLIKSQMNTDKKNRKVNKEQIKKKNIEPLMKRVKRFADRGELNEALIECENLLEIENNRADIHYLHGMILRELGYCSESVLALKRTLYLDSSFIVAHIALGSELYRIGKIEDSNRSFSYAYELLISLDPKSCVNYSEGLTAGDMLKIISIERNMSSTKEEYGR